MRTQTGHPSTPRCNPEDPWFGLLTNPPGEWGLIGYGGNGVRALILKGGEEFVNKALNLIASYGEGNGQYRSIDLLANVQHVNGGSMLPIRQDKLKDILSLWFYTQLFPSLAPQDMDILDEEGNLVGYRELTAKEEETIMKVATQRAEAFYAMIDHNGLGLDFGLNGGYSPSEHVIGHVAHVTAEE